MYAKYSKCEFWLSEVKFICQMVYGEGISVNSSKIEAVMSWERPSSVSDIWNFLGLVGYFRRFMDDFFKQAALMTLLTLKGVKFYWDNDCQKSLVELKTRLTL